MKEQRRLAAIVATDVVGYSRLMGRDESGTVARLRRVRAERLEPILTRRGGRIVKLTGDGALIEFGSAVEALSAAIEFQQVMTESEAERPEAERLVFRVGVHLGDVIVDGDDLYGDGINIAARLEAEAPPGGVVVSGDLHNTTVDRLKAAFEDLGQLALKNIERPMQAYAVRWQANDWSRLSSVASPSVTATPALSDKPLPLPDKPSIAVLPFQNMSGDPEQEYFVDGLVEDIITALSRFKSLFVIARNSTFSYKGKSPDIRHVGKELGVRYVLEGSVRKAGGKVRITGQLIEAESGTHLWADRFDGSLEDIFDLQDQVTTSVVGAVAPRLDQAEIARAKRKPVENLDAYDCFLRGMARMHELTRPSYEEALRLFYRAIELDPGFATPYGMVARCHAYIRGQNWSVDRDREVAETRRMAGSVSTLGPDDALALTSAGYALARICREDDVGMAMMDQALSINENLAVGWSHRGGLAMLLGQHDLAIEQLSRALRLSPLDPDAYWAEAMMALSHIFQSQYAEGLTWATRSLTHRPNYMVAFWALAVGNALWGKIDEARKFMPRIRELNPELRMSTLKDYVSTRRPEDIAKAIEGFRLAGLPE
ncbi:MAG: adenylate/guanylate cyclase domain-containing protein [Reyranellaceae bacterium]